MTRLSRNTLFSAKITRSLTVPFSFNFISALSLFGVDGGLHTWQERWTVHCINLDHEYVRTSTRPPMWTSCWGGAKYVLRRYDSCCWDCSDSWRLWCHSIGTASGVISCFYHMIVVVDVEEIVAIGLESEVESECMRNKTFQGPRIRIEWWNHEAVLNRLEWNWRAT